MSETGSLPHTIHQINSNLQTELVNSKILKHLEENIEKYTELE